MSFTFHYDYFGDSVLKTAFVRFLKEIHGLDLTLWDQLGYWDYDRYRAFSFFDGDRIVATTNIYSIDLVVAGEPIRAAQFSGVGTHPDYRRQGLNAELTRRAIEWAKPTHDFFYLFADEDAQLFYEACGFQKANEYFPTIDIPVTDPQGEMRKLNVDDDTDRQLIYELAAKREPVSNALGALNERLFMYWCVYWLRESIFYIPSLGCLMLMDRKESKITVHDIVSRRMPVWSELYPYITNASNSSLEFQFMIDKLSIGGNVEHVASERNGLYLMDAEILSEKQILFPLTAHA